MKKLICIRHGETTGDVEDRFGGWYDDELSPEGHAQAAQLTSEMTAMGIDAIYCSSLGRARQTAAHLAKEIGCTVIAMDDLRERNQYGALTGMQKQDAIAQYPDLVEAVKDRLNTLPDAESYDSFKHRVSSAFETVRAKDDVQTAAIVWHGGGMRVLFRDILKAGELEKIGDCSWVELALDNDQWTIQRMMRLVPKQ